ncbi:hypothetical protein M1M25_gp040 [Tenacibaculum phage Gundel_1]|uniref:Uncharacterized protein n=1 Tax=Tenacibaculum phage Gundel_1 TaxID=2745672 RepID=A0A8E4ZK60_9CAUD|nr:hypothetical protein M1M25_gp040 [Tenacibaculum phage Gundel_1]QQV91473.1 hypothetical protein Gundel1_40 [Tenacibaculum phage Gundel_1]
MKTELSNQKLVFVPVKLSERKPDLNQRIFFYNSRTKGGLISEYIPNELIETSKGKLKELKNVKVAVDMIINNHTHWLEPTVVTTKKFVLRNDKNYDFLLKKEHLLELINEARHPRSINKTPEELYNKYF